MIASTPVLHMLQRSCHASTFLTCFNVPHMFQWPVLPASTFFICFNSPRLHSRAFTIFTSERGLNTSHAGLAHVYNTRVNVLSLVTFVYFSINFVAASHISLAFNSVFFGYIS